MYRVSPFVSRFVLALLGGAVMASFWVNLFPISHHDAIEFRLVDLALPPWITPLPLSLAPMSAVSGGLMALFVFLSARSCGRP
jgi:hypothetical protein